MVWQFYYICHPTYSPNLVASQNSNIPPTSSLSDEYFPENIKMAREDSWEDQTPVPLCSSIPPLLAGGMNLFVRPPPPLAHCISSLLPRQGLHSYNSPLSVSPILLAFLSLLNIFHLYINMPQKQNKINPLGLLSSSYFISPYPCKAKILVRVIYSPYAPLLTSQSPCVTFAKTTLVKVANDLHLAVSNTVSSQVST